MTNAALQLAALLQNWELDPGQSPIGARVELAGNSWEQAWRDSARAVVLLDQVIAELDAMDAAGEDTADYRAHTADWYQAVFSYHYPWGEGVSAGGPVVPIPSLQILRIFGNYLAKFGSLNTGSPTKRLELLGCIEEAIGLIESELADWDRSETQYLYRIIASAREVLELRAIHGEVDLRSLLNELIGALTSIALDLRISDGPDSTRFQKFMMWIGKTTAVARGVAGDVNVITSIAQNAAKVIGQITAG